MSTRPRGAWPVILLILAYWVFVVVLVANAEEPDGSQVPPRCERWVK